MDGHAITVQRLPGVPLPRALADAEAPGALAHPQRLPLVRRAGQLALNLLLVLMMASVLSIIEGGALLDEQPRLKAYLHRCTARPAYRRAMAAHLADLRDAP